MRKRKEKMEIRDTMTESVTANKHGKRFAIIIKPIRHGKYKSEEF